MLRFVSMLGLAMMICSLGLRATAQSATGSGADSALAAAQRAHKLAQVHFDEQERNARAQYNQAALTAQPEAMGALNAKLNAQLTRIDQQRIAEEALFQNECNRIQAEYAMDDQSGQSGSYSQGQYTDPNGGYGSSDANLRGPLPAPSGGGSGIAGGGAANSGAFGKPAGGGNAGWLDRTLGAVGKINNTVSGVANTVGQIQGLINQFHPRRPQSQPAPRSADAPRSEASYMSSSGDTTWQAFTPDGSGQPDGSRAVPLRSNSASTSAAIQRQLQWINQAIGSENAMHNANMEALDPNDTDGMSQEQARHANALQYLVKRRTALFRALNADPNANAH